jgi:hypothetical protein
MHSLLCCLLALSSDDLLACIGCIASFQELITRSIISEFPVMITFPIWECHTQVWLHWLENLTRLAESFSMGIKRGNNRFKVI